jgi:dephospho-CoA kinase
MGGPGVVAGNAWTAAASMADVHLIALTGGIASGKTTVAERLASRGAVHINADQLARRVVEPGTPTLARVVEEFGDGILRNDGSLDRAALGSRVFADPQALKRLNGIVHPAIWELTRSLIREAKAEDPDAIVVYDVPLLVEAEGDRGLGKQFDLIAVTHADEATRVQRMIDLRGMSGADAANRVRSQATDDERLAIADVVIDTNGSLEHTLEQADALYDRLRSAGSEPPVSGAP